MPVSHIGLSVENLAASASFYAAALHPLGYRYFGTRDDQLGFGVLEADFFLAPVKSSSKPAPIHVAFAAPDRVAVREFYASALTAGGTPAGPPGYRGQEHEVFNTAIIDLDGNTIEAVFREFRSPDTPLVPGLEVVKSPDPGFATADPRAVPPSPSSRAPSVTTYDVPLPSVPPPRHAYSPPASVLSRATSHIARSVSQNRPRSSEPVLENPSKAFVGTLIGAAAGAAAIFAMISSERDSARKERSFHEAMSSSARRPSNNRSSASYVESDLKSSSKLHRAATYSGPQDASSRRNGSSYRRTTYDGVLDTIPQSRVYERYGPVRRDSGVSIASRKSNSSKRYDDRSRPVFKDSFNAGRAIDWIAEAVESYSGRRSSAPASANHTRESSKQREGRHSHSSSSSRQARPTIPRSRTSAADIPLPASIADSRASIRDKGLYSRDRAGRHERSRTVPGPVPLDVIKNTLGKSTKKDSFRRAYDQETVLPEDSISCASSRRSSLRQGQKTGDPLHRSYEGDSRRSKSHKGSAGASRSRKDDERCR